MSGSGELGSCRWFVVDNGRCHLLNLGLPRPVPPFERVGWFFCGLRFKLFGEWGLLDRDFPRIRIWWLRPYGSC